MKVLRSTATFYPHVTGPAYQAYKISKGLEGRGYQSPIVTTDSIPAEEEPGYPPEMNEDDPFPFNIIRRKPLFSIDQYRFPPQSLYDYFSESPDIIHCHGYHNAIKDSFYIGKLINDKPFIIHGHGSFSKERDPTIERSLQFKLYDLLWSRTIDAADAVVVSSEQEREDAIRFGVSKEKVWTIPVGKEEHIYTSVDRDQPKDHVRALFVGRLAPRRNIELLIKSLAKLDREDLQLRIVGGEGTLSDSSRDDYLTELKRLSTKLNIDKKVTFTGPKYGKELIKEYRSAHFFVNPSHYENFGQANLEAAFAGLPLIATPTGIAIDLVEPGETGFHFSSEGELCDRIDHLINHGLIGEMSEKISNRAKLNYTWPSILDKYEDLYRSVLRSEI